MIVDLIWQWLQEAYGWIEQIQFYNFTGLELLSSLILFLSLVSGSYILKYILLNRLENQADRELDTPKEMYIQRTIEIANNFLSWPLILPFSLVLSTNNLELTPFQDIILKGIIYGLLSILAIRYTFRFYDTVETYYQNKIGEQSKQITEFVKLIMKVLTVLFIALIYLSLLNIKVTTFLAGFGIAGIVVGFALQEVVSDLFASVSIYLDQPFEIGDRVEINGEKGIIENIGIRSTKIRSLDGHLLVVSNQNLTNSNIKNYKKMRRRRAKNTISVAYETDPDTIEKIPDMLEEIIDDIRLADFDRAYVVNLGDYAVEYELVFYVRSRKKSVFLRVQHQVYTSILRKFAEEGIEIPYPKREHLTETLKKQEGVKTSQNATAS